MPLGDLRPVPNSTGDNAILSTLNRLSKQNDVIAAELASLKQKYTELKRKHNSLTIWKLLRRRHV